MERILIGGLDLDMYPKEKVNVTFQLNSISDVATRQTSFSNSIKIPKTANNILLLGHLGVIGNQSNAPYTKVLCDYISDDVTLINQGHLQVAETTATEYKVVLYSGIITLAETLGSLMISDLDLSNLAHTRTQATISAGHTATANYAYGIYASSVEVEPEWRDDGNASIVTIHQAYPVLFVHTLFDKILTEAGYTSITGDFLTDQSFLDEVITVGGGLLTNTNDQPVNTPSTVNEFWDGSANDDLLTPAIRQLAFVKDVLSRYGQIAIVEGTTISFIGMDDILNGVYGSVDWSSRIVEIGSEKYTPNYAQANLFTYTYSDKTDTGGDGYLSVGNTTLSVNKTSLTSIMDWIGKTVIYEERVTSTDTPVPEIKLWEYKEINGVNTMVGTKDTPKLFKRNYDGAFQWFLADVRSANLATKTGAVLLDNTETAMQWYIDNYYSTFTNMLTKYKELTVTIQMNSIDLSTVDFTKLVYLKQTGKYYYVNNIKTRGAVSIAQLTEIPTVLT